MKFRKSCHSLFDPDWYSSWYSTKSKSTRSLKSKFINNEFKEGHNPSPFVNTKFCLRNYGMGLYLKMIEDPCSYNNVQLHPLINLNYQESSLKIETLSSNFLHHPSLNLTNWISNSDFIQHSLLNNTAAKISPLERPQVSLSDFYSLAGNSLEEGRFIFETTNWDEKFLLDTLKNVSIKYFY